MASFEGASDVLELDGSLISVSINEEGSICEWRPPCLPVLKLKLLLVTDATNNKIAVNISNEENVPDVPYILRSVDSDTCFIQLNGIRRLLLWKWTELDEELGSTESEEWSDQSEPDGDDVVVLEEEDGNVINVGEHAVNFKVLGVTFQERQKYIQCALTIIDNGGHVPAQLVVEPDNPVDPGGISVVFDTGADNYGEVCVGYLPKELKGYVAPLLASNDLKEVRIVHIKLRANFNPMGLYILLQLTRKGRWPHYVVMKSWYAK